MISYVKGMRVSFGLILGKTNGSITKGNFGKIENNGIY